MEKTSDENNSAKETKALDTLDATAVMFVGALAKNVMEGGTKMFEKLTQVNIFFEPCDIYYLQTTVQARQTTRE